MPFGNLHLRHADSSYRESVRPESGHRRTQARPNAADRPTTRRTTPATREESTAFRGQSQTDLSVLTAEGDRISISLAAQVQYASTSKTGAGGSSQEVSVSSSSLLRVSVEGDLSKAELKDLGTLLKNLNQASQPTTETTGVR